jgi:hypothetical protein
MEARVETSQEPRAALMDVGLETTETSLANMEAYPEAMVATMERYEVHNEEMTGHLRAIKD